MTVARERQREIDAEVKGVDRQPTSRRSRWIPRDVEALDPDPAQRLIRGRGRRTSGHNRQPVRLRRTVTTGIVSPLQREIEAPTASRSPTWSRPTRTINPATPAARSSTPQGHVIGSTHSSRPAAASGSVGIGFAVPAGRHQAVAPQLKKAARSSAPTSASRSDVTAELAKELGLPLDAGRADRRPPRAVRPTRRAFGAATGTSDRRAAGRRRAR